jgi:hypothetical protein
MERNVEVAIGARSWSAPRKIAYVTTMFRALYSLPGSSGRREEDSLTIGDNGTTKGIRTGGVRGSKAREVPSYLRHQDGPRMVHFRKALTNVTKGALNNVQRRARMAYSII